jgi:hypothetical protein
MKRIAQAMCVVMVLAALPKSSWAQGEKASKAEVGKYAALEAKSPETASFEGGDAAGALLFIVLVAAIVVLVYYLVDSHHHAMGPRPEKDGGLAQLPPLFR